MIPQSESREGDAAALTQLPMDERLGRALESRVEGRRANQGHEWGAIQRALLLLGSAAMLLPTAIALLVLGAILPLERTELFGLLVVASVMFLAVVQLAWKAHEALPSKLLPSLQAQFDRESHRPTSLVQ